MNDQTSPRNDASADVGTLTLAVAARFLLLVGVFLTVMLIVGVLAFQTLFKLKVNGPIYAGIVEQKDLLADILPPPMYVLETYMTALQMLDEDDPNELKADAARIRALKNDFATRCDYWIKPLAGTDVGGCADQAQVQVHARAVDGVRCRPRTRRSRLAVRRSRIPLRAQPRPPRRSRRSGTGARHRARSCRSRSVHRS